MTTDEMTRDEVQHFASKLNAFGQTLSAKEQLLLAAILRRAASAGDDVEGFDMNMQPEAPHQWVNPYAGTGGHALSGGEVYAPPQVHTTTCDFTNMVAPAIGYPYDK